MTEAFKDRRESLNLINSFEGFLQLLAKAGDLFIVEKTLGYILIFFLETIFHSIDFHAID